MKPGKTSAAVPVLYGLTALVWIAHCVMTLRHGGQLGFLQFLCVVLWVSAFFIQFRRYRNGKDE